MTELLNKNGLDIIVKKNKNTPRIALALYFKLNQQAKYSGTYSLITKLLLQGTKTKTAEQLALEIEENGVDISIKCKKDYFSISAFFLNEDLQKTLDIIADILQNSTFEDLKKEVFKFKGEIISDLDIPKVRAYDVFGGEIFKEHPYLSSYDKILSEIDKITKEDIKNSIQTILNAKKVIVMTGDFEESSIELLSEKFSFLKNAQMVSDIPSIPPIKEDKVIKIAKEDINQAQVIQGWCVNSWNSEDYPKLTVMNNLMGSSGLSSRLFYELRDRQGLAYDVRSSYETLEHGGILNFYIATSPVNIKKSLEGFKIEIEKLQNNVPGDDEVQGAKENVLGKLDYFLQTNMQQAVCLGSDYIKGLGLGFQTKFREMIMNVTPKDLSDMAKKYLSNKSITVVLAQNKYLEY